MMGKAFAYRTGGFLRDSFTCAVNADGTLTVEMGRREGR